MTRTNEQAEDPNVATDDAARESGAKDAAPTPGTEGREPVTGNGALLARLAMLALLPTILTVLVTVCFVYFTQTADGRLADAPVFFGGLATILALGVCVQLVWVVRVTRGIIGSVERLVRAVDDADNTALESSSRRPDWELALLHRRVQKLLATRAEADEQYRAALHAHRQVEAAAAVLDRVATQESPGDAGGFSGLLAPIGTSLRALIERLDRREAAVAARLGALRRAVAGVGEEMGGIAGRFEGAFMGLLEVVSNLKDSRLAVPAIERELDVAGHARGKEMVQRLGARIDESLTSLGEVSSQLESSARVSRRLTSRSELLARAAAQVATSQAAGTLRRRASHEGKAPGILSS